MSLLPFPYACITLVQFVYPLCETLRKVWGKSSAADWEYAQWMMHWVICGIWIVLDSIVLWVAYDYVPFFLDLKCLFFAWLVHPSFNGGAYLWYDVVQKLYAPFDEKHFQKIIESLGKVQPPAALKTGTTMPTASNKEEVIDKLLTGANSEADAKAEE